ncbi:MAG: aldo/keto reductase [Myxococcales bacterium]|nr:aldo/keto reductase [Myxococcales bacterium]
MTKLSRRHLLTVSGATSAGLALEQVLDPSVAWAGDLPQVPRRKLGKTGKTVPILLLGGGMGFDARFDPRIAEALRFGLDYVDAARVYDGGKCESGIAAFNRKAKARDKMWITSKSKDHGPDDLEKSVGESLKALETSWVDLYFLHAVEDPGVFTPALKSRVEALKKSGKIRHFGFSCHNDNVVELLQLAAKTPWVESVMFRYNFRTYGNKELNAAMDAAHKAGVGLIAMKTQGSEASFPNASKTFEQTGKWNKYQAVLKAVWADKRISAVVSHMDNLEKLRENIAAAVDKQKLSRAEMESLERYAAATRAYACDGCDHLCGAAVDAKVQIGNTMRYLMYHQSYGREAEARALFRALPDEARALDGVDFSRANAACPHGVDVAGHMRRALDMLA